VKTRVYYEEIKGELNRILIHECWYNERILNTKPEGSIRYTGLIEGLEHLKIESRLRGLRGGWLESVKGECDLETIDVPSMFKFIRKTVSLTRMCPTLDRFRLEM
jgi:hypothetical protein